MVRLAKRERTTAKWLPTPTPVKRQQEKKYRKEPAAAEKPLSGCTAGVQHERKEGSQATLHIESSVHGVLGIA